MNLKLWRFLSTDMERLKPGARSWNLGVLVNFVSIRLCGRIEQIESGWIAGRPQIVVELSSAMILRLKSHPSGRIDGNRAIVKFSGIRFG
jgi:hypothetical protein